MLISMSWTSPTAQCHSFTLSHSLWELIPYGTRVLGEGSPFRNENCVTPEFPCAQHKSYEKAEVCGGTLQRYGQPRKVARVAFQRRKYADEYSVTLSTVARRQLVLSGDPSKLLSETAVPTLLPEACQCLSCPNAGDKAFVFLLLYCCRRNSWSLSQRYPLCLSIRLRPVPPQNQ